MLCELGLKGGRYGKEAISAISDCEKPEVVNRSVLVGSLEDALKVPVFTSDFNKGKLQ